MSRHFVTPQKSYGQHYLIDKSILSRINSAVDLYKNGHNILEIGPGMGALTGYLIKENPTFTCIEVDPRCVAYLKEQEAFRHLQIIEADFLKIDLNDLLKKETMVVGNFPYNISSQIVFRILDHRDRVPVALGMFQKEMAHRIAAPHNNKEYGVISVLAQLDYDMEVLFDIPPSAFNPPPKVMSSILLMKRKAQRPAGLDDKLFRKIVKAGFNQRRKMLRSALNSVLKKDYLQQAYFNKRAEQLSLTDFIQLTQDAAAHVQ
jgi:16S rRNA (adenine1518-N6/adenine1519-N6)-dimethyltransferase